LEKLKGFEMIPKVVFEIISPIQPVATYPKEPPFELLLKKYLKKSNKKPLKRRKRKPQGRVDIYV